MVSIEQVPPLTSPSPSPSPQSRSFLPFLPYQRTQRKQRTDYWYLCKYAVLLLFICGVFLLSPRENIIHPFISLNTINNIDYHNNININPNTNTNTNSNIHRRELLHYEKENNLDYENTENNENNNNNNNSDQNDNILPIGNTTRTNATNPSASREIDISTGG